jgi:hypothetical protein
LIIRLPVSIQYHLYAEAILALLALALLAQIALHAQKPLDIYFLDTEGGQATLLWRPPDNRCWWTRLLGGNQGMPPGGPAITRDADRITAVKLANIGVLDYVDSSALPRRPRQ